jgi:hypothetical protein
MARRLSELSIGAPESFDFPDSNIDSGLNLVEAGSNITVQSSVLANDNGFDIGAVSALPVSCLASSRWQIIASIRRKH